MTGRELEVVRELVAAANEALLTMGGNAEATKLAHAVGAARYWINESEREAA